MSLLLTSGIGSVLRIGGIREPGAPLGQHDQQCSELVVNALKPPQRLVELPLRLIKLGGRVRKLIGQVVNLVAQVLRVAGLIGGRGL